MQTAKSAVITKRFPFSPRHLLQWFCFPKLVSFLFHTNAKCFPFERLYTIAPWQSQWLCFLFRPTLMIFIFETQALNHADGGSHMCMWCEKDRKSIRLEYGNLPGLWGNLYLPFLRQPKSIQSIWQQGHCSFPPWNVFRVILYFCQWLFWCTCILFNRTVYLKSGRWCRVN